MRDRVQQEQEALGQPDRRHRRRAELGDEEHVHHRERGLQHQLQHHRHREQEHRAAHRDLGVVRVRAADGVAQRRPCRSVRVPARRSRMAVGKHRSAWDGHLVCGWLPPYRRTTNQGLPIRQRHDDTGYPDALYGARRVASRTHRHVRPAATPRVLQRRARGVSRHGEALRRRARSRRTSTPGTRLAPSRATLYRRAAELGIIGIGYPEEYGGTPADIFYKLVAAEEFARAGCGGVQASAELARHRAAADRRAGSDDAEAPRPAAGAARREDRRAGITEPGGGSDVAALKTTRACATATTTSSTARRPSSPRACAPTSSRRRAHRSGRTGARAASRRW